MQVRKIDQMSRDWPRLALASESVPHKKNDMKPDITIHIRNKKMFNVI